MNGICNKSLLPALGISLCFFCALTVVVQPVRAAAEEVKLTLRIHPGTGNGNRSLERYVVELRNSSGESIRMANAMSGDKVHFKHLKPDIYRACLHGIQGFKQCTSMDLFPPR